MDEVLKFYQYTASTTQRLFAEMIDQMIGFLLFLPVSIQLVSSWMQTGEMTVEWAWVVLCVVLRFSYRWIFLGLLSATIGKMICGLRVVDFKSGGSLTGSQSLIRVLTDELSFFFGPAFRVIALLRFDRRHLSDLIAETQVRQVLPRTKDPRRRPLIATGLFCYFFFFSFISTYQFVQTLEWDGRYVTISSYMEDIDL